MNMTGENTENQILAAAREVFIAKGYEGARMQEIADRAGINKALLHYYFRSKENLFESVFSEVAAHLFPSLRQLLESDLGIKEKVSFFVKIYLSALEENPYIPSFVINTLNANPEHFLKYIKQSGINPRLLQKQIDDEAAHGLILSIKAEHLLVNIVAMCLFPVVARPMIQNVFQMNDNEYQAYLDTRQSEITDFVLKSLAV